MKKILFLYILFSTPAFASVINNGSSTLDFSFSNRQYNTAILSFYNNGLLQQSYSLGGGDVYPNLTSYGGGGYPPSSGSVDAKFLPNGDSIVAWAFSGGNSWATSYFHSYYEIFDNNGLPVGGSTSLTSGMAELYSFGVSINTSQNGQLAINTNGTNIYRNEDGYPKPFINQTLIGPTFTTINNTMTSNPNLLEISFSDLLKNSDATDNIGNVNSFIISNILSGSLLIGSSLENSSAWSSLNNKVIDANHNAYWIPNTGSTGIVNPFSIVAADNLGLTTGNAIQVSVNVVPIPNAVWLFGSALGGLGFVNRRKTT